MNTAELTVRLTAYGADIIGIKDRFLGDMDLYAECFKKLLSEPDFHQLGVAIKENDYTAAFASAHSLKGLVANMGLTPLYTPICAVVESLRSNSYEHLDTQYEAIMLGLDELKQLL